MVLQSDTEIEPGTERIIGGRLEIGGTNKEYYGIFRNGLLKAVSGVRWFSCLDLASGYWQMPVAAKDRAKTAFSTHRGQFQWKVMPFGLTSGTASFTRLMKLPLDGLTSIYCLVYLNGMVVWSATFDEHLHRLRQVFGRIRKAGLKLKPAKCQFLKKRVTFLGHVVLGPGR